MLLLSLIVPHVAPFLLFQAFQIPRLGRGSLKRHSSQFRVRVCKIYIRV